MLHANVSAPQGCVLSPLLYSLYTYDCVTTSNSTTIIKFVDDTVVVGLINNNDETAYLQEVKNLERWCQENNLLLNVSKTKKLIVDFSTKRERSYQPLNICGTPVERVDSFRYLGAHITQDLSWSCHTNTLVLKTFYTCTIESVLTGSITSCFGNSTMQDSATLMKGIIPRHRTAQSPQSHDHEEEKEKDDITSSLCSLCGQNFDLPLLLPCAHTLCGRCLTQKARLDKPRSAQRCVSHVSRTICTILCPRCCHGVELPCFDWSIATTCLPLDPTATIDPRCGAQEEDVNEEKIREPTGQKPAAGRDMDLSEEEMERSVSGLLFTLDFSSIDPPLQITNSALTVTFKDSGGQTGARDLCTSLPQVCADVEIRRGQYYWEVDVCNSALYRIGEE
ncbi:hypothetical protein C0J45_10698 [Silurus meridionalis]|nr:hypothetical protein C0J45_10698 [Silurus meridionalis]